MRRIVAGSFLILALAASPAPSPTAVATPDVQTLERQLDLASSFYRNGDYEAALRIWQAGLAEARKKNDSVYAAQFLTGIGTVQDALARYPEALASWQQALTINRKTGATLAEATDLESIATLKDFLGQYAEALVAAQLALSIYREMSSGLDGTSVLEKMNYQIREASVLGIIGSIEQDLGAYTDALAAEQQSLALNREVMVPVQELEASDLTMIGEIENGLRRYADALSSERQALTIYRGEGSRSGEAADLRRIGVIESNRGAFARGLAAEHNALALFRKVRNRPGAAAALGSIADIEKNLGKYAAARRDSAAAVRLNVALRLPSVWKDLSVLAFADSKLGPNYEVSAQRHYDEALARVERLRAGLYSPGERTSFFGTALFVYDEYIAFLVDLDKRHPRKGYDRKALQILERKAGRSVLEEIGASTAQHFGGVPAEIVQQETFAGAVVRSDQERYSKALASANPDHITLNSAKTDLDTAIKKQDALDKRVKASYPRYYALRHPRPIPLDYIQRQVLKHGEVMLIYDLLYERSVLWVVDRQHMQMLRLSPRRRIDALVAALHQHIERIFAQTRTPARDLPGFLRDSFALYRQLVPKEAARALLSAKSLVVVPSGSLYEMPFEALATQDPARNPERPHYLIENVAIAYVSSASLLGVVSASYSNHRSAPQTLLAFANPSFGSPGMQVVSPPIVPQPDGVPASLGSLQLKAMRPSTASGIFPQLPGTVIEANAVRDALRAPANSVISGDDATRAHILSLNSGGTIQNYRYLLFATHAVLPDQIEGLTQPAIVLAHPERGDGFLTMADVFGLKLNADFVTLSACDTGIVTNPSGEGISGLTRAFLYAGTPAISVTLWQVDDDAAPQITPRFFAAMKSGKTAAQALREAQLAMIRSNDPRFNHPFAWAPYVIFGDGDLVTKDLRSDTGAVAPRAGNHQVRRSALHKPPNTTLGLVSRATRRTLRRRSVAGAFAGR